MLREEWVPYCIHWSIFQCMPKWRHGTISPSSSIYILKKMATSVSFFP